MPELTKHVVMQDLLRKAPLSRCARHIFSQQDALQPLVSFSASYETNLTSVSHAYLIHYTKNRQRLSFQKTQLSRLGVNTSVVVGYDAEAISESVRM